VLNSELHNLLKEFELNDITRKGLRFSLRNTITNDSALKALEESNPSAETEI